MSFLLSPSGRIVLIVIAFFAWTVYQRDLAAKGARDTCQADQLRVTLAEMTRQRDAAQQALNSAEKQAERTQSEISALEKDNAEAKSSLPEGIRSNSCVIPESTIKRLRNIR